LFAGRERDKNAICPKLVYPDGRRQVSIRRLPTHANIWFSRGSPLRHLSPTAYTQKYPKSPARVPAIAATFMMIRRVAYEQVGGLDEGYFLYVEDTDICKRWHDRGWEAWVDPRVVVTHDWQGGSRRNRKLARLHRASVRRYFRLHHGRKRLRNLLLLAVLGLANMLDRVRFRG
jgi:hypothetical protein